MGARLFFGPLFHSMFPGQAFNPKPRHMFLTYLLSLVRLAYQPVATELRSLGENIALDNRHYGYLHNIRLLVEYFIPVVLAYNHFTYLTSRYMIMQWRFDATMEDQ